MVAEESHSPQPEAHKHVCSLEQEEAWPRDVGLTPHEVHDYWTGTDIS